MRTKRCNYSPKILLPIFAVFAIFLTGCFSPWAGSDGSITINFGGQKASVRYAINPSDLDTMEFEIILDGPGGTITKEVKESGPVTIQVTPGNWNVRVRAIGDRPEGYNASEELVYNGTTTTFEGDFSERMLRALGIASPVKVKAGAATTVELEMLAATEVSSWKELQFAILKAEEEKEEYIVVSKGFYQTGGMCTVVQDNKNITLIADEAVEIKRELNASSSDSRLFIVEGALTMGTPGMKGHITIDGTTDHAEEVGSIIKVEGGRLVINDGVTLANNNKNIEYNISNLSSSGGGVNVASGTFIMNGGKICDNSVGNGGGVYIDDGTFNMNGGTISGNITGIEGNGGGVYVSSGAAFIMSGGDISGNTADNSGGGVYINSDASFTMSGGNIHGNTADNSGGGVYVENCEIELSGGNIGPNNTASNGGGVYIIDYSDFPSAMLTMSGGSIVNNTAKSREGGDDGFGGGVYANNCVIKFYSGAISGNIAVNGGGVFLYGIANFDGSRDMVKNNSLNNFNALSLYASLITAQSSIWTNGVYGTIIVEGKSVEAGSFTGYQKGDSVTITANPNPGYAFVKWVSDDSVDIGDYYLISNEQEYTYTFSSYEDITLYAVFDYDGTNTNAFRNITNVDDLKKIGNDSDWPLDGNYALMKDFPYYDFPYGWWDDFSPIGDYDNPFIGTFDGRGFGIDMILNINSSLPQELYAGLFSVIGEDGKVKNLSLYGSANIFSSSGNTIYAGAVAGMNSGTIINITSNVKVSASGFVSDAYSGGIAGANKGKISNCSVTGMAELDVATTSSSGAFYAGGIVGDLTSGTVSFCQTYGKVSASTSNIARPYAGGIAGIQQDGFIRNCVAMNGINDPSNNAIEAEVCGYIYGNSTGGERSNNNYYWKATVDDGSINTDGGSEATIANISSPNWWGDNLDLIIINDKDANENEPWVWYEGENRPVLWFY